MKPLKQISVIWQNFNCKSDENSRFMDAHRRLFESLKSIRDDTTILHLINNPSDARAYADLKQKLVKEYTDDREEYTRQKGEFIMRILNLQTINHNLS